MVLHERVLRQFSVFPCIHAPIFPMNYKRLQNVFNMVTKQKQNWNTERIMQFFKIAAYVQVANCMAWCIMRLVHFCPYINGLRFALVSEYSLSVCFMRYWLVWAVREREREHVWRLFVFVIVDVKYIIHYKRICKFICSL